MTLLDVSSSTESTYVRKIFVGSLPLMFVLLYLVYEIYRRSQLPPYAADYVPPNERDDDGLDEEALAAEVPSYATPLQHMVWLFLYVALLSVMVAVYTLHTMPRKRILMKRFLETGRTFLGDVLYPDEPNYFTNCMGGKYGQITYKHPIDQYDHSYIRRSARLYERYSREWVTIVVLPQRPYSGQPRADLEISYIAAEKEKVSLMFLGWYAIGWYVSCTLAATYAVVVMEQNKVEEELPRMWLWWAIGVVSTPVLGIVLNFVAYQSYFRWMTRGDARLLQEGDVGAHRAAELPKVPSDLSGYRYLPAHANAACGSLPITRADTGSLSPQALCGAMDSTTSSGTPLDDTNNTSMATHSTATTKTSRA